MNPNDPVTTTGRDGTPTGFRVLAYSDQQLADHGGWGAVMGYYVRAILHFPHDPGRYPIIFHGGFNGWGDWLSAGTPKASQIALNVINKLQARQVVPVITPSWGTAPTLPGTGWEILDEWSSDQNLVNTATGFTASIFGHLFLLNELTLYRRSPYKELAPQGLEKPGWEAIDTLPAGTVTVGLAGHGRNGKAVFVFTPTGYYERDGVLPKVAGYSRFGEVGSSGFGVLHPLLLPAHTQAVAASEGPMPYALTYLTPVEPGSERLYMAEPLIQVGRAPGVRKITTHDQKLIGVRADGSVVFREGEMELDLRWMPLCGASPLANLVPVHAIAAYLGRLYTIIAGSIFWHTCAIDGPYRPGKVIFYSNSSCSVELAMPTGQLRPLTAPSLSSGWTHVAEADPEWNVPVGDASLVFYCATNGNIATCTMSPEGTIATPLLGNVGSGWQVVRRIAPSTFLFYKSTSATKGAGQVWQMASDGGFSNPSGWSSIVTTFGQWTDCITSSEGGILFVDSRTNHGYACRWTGTSFSADMPGSGLVTFDPSLYVNGNNAGDLRLAPVGNGLILLYRRRPQNSSVGGQFQIVRVDSQGAFQSESEPGTRWIGTTYKDWSHVVGTSSGLLLFYAASGGDVPAGRTQTAGVQLLQNALGHDLPNLLFLSTYKLPSGYTLVAAT
jgi:hypothetical protein